MVFSSTSFIFFILPLFLIGDTMGRWLKNSTWRNVVLLVISLLFYTWGESTNIILLITMGVINYIGVRFFDKTAHRKALVTGLVSINLLTLGVFKYLPWILSLIAPEKLGDVRISLPLGISFFTFHAISYVIDVYRKNIVPAQSPLKFMTYFCMFPHLVAGPIVRYSQVEHELTNRADGRELFSFGMYRFVLGLNKKLLVANIVAPVADIAFMMSATNNLGFIDSWLGIAAYTLQIYFDFSAYSDMAIGLAAMAGFKFNENFNRPYSAISMRDFWHRWHISLSTFLRDYLYIPLGGNRVGQTRTIINLFVVFFLCGLWHGANFTFIIWGLWHGLFLVLERFSLGRLLGRVPAIVGRFYAIAVVMFGWVFFRSESLPNAISYIKIMFSFNAHTVILDSFATGCVGIMIGILLCIIPDKFLPQPTSQTPKAFSLGIFVMQVGLLSLSFIMLITNSRNPFIYFNF